MFFLICAHADRTHLATLARLVRILDGDIVDQLLQAETGEEFLQLLVAKETRVAAEAGP